MNLTTADRNLRDASSKLAAFISLERNAREFAASDTVNAADLDRDEEWLEFLAGWKSAYLGQCKAAAADYVTALDNAMRETDVALDFIEVIDHAGSTPPTEETP